MGGLNLEVLRMGMYVFSPIAAFYLCNLPEFRREQVQDMMNQVFPPLEDTNRDLPFNRADNATLLEKFKQEQKDRQRNSSS